jgi:hypothetical protein
VSVIKQIAKLRTGQPDVDRAIAHVADVVNPVLRELLGPAAAGDWIVPTLQNGWTSSAGAFLRASFMKDSLDRVHLRGTIGGAGPLGVAVFNLPPGYRPTAISQHIVLGFNGTTQIPAYVNVNPNGDVFILNVGANVAFAIDGISFDLR